ncbi:URI1 [Blepharisma stoltei]|uniref:Uncharacterized protein n=1 Tax=Blepharisma stoltei TaxID=1481888 RepID=A0AAU9JDS6_9CILI|nr:unnamed protein product [Blepharisma stoltei]
MEDNQKNLDILEGAINRYNDVSQIIHELPNKLDHEIMVPLGKVGFVKGRIVHTNEIWVNIGKDTFIKTTTIGCDGIIERKIKAIQEEIKRFKPKEIENKSIEDVFKRIKELEIEEKGGKSAQENLTVGKIVERNPIEENQIEEVKKPEKLSKFKQEMNKKKSS